jgi:hypothetical protein
MSAKNLENYRFRGFVAKLDVKILFAFSAAKAMRGHRRLLPRIATCVVIFIALTSLLPTKLTDIAYDSAYTRILKWNSTSSYDDDSIGGIRIVVFGGGDITTPNKRQEDIGFVDKSWTDILCEQVTESRNFICEVRLY